AHRDNLAGLVDLQLRWAAPMVSLPGNHPTLRSACWDPVRDRRPLSESALLRPGLPEPARGRGRPGRSQSLPTASALGRLRRPPRLVAEATTQNAPPNVSAALRRA